MELIFSNNKKDLLQAFAVGFTCFLERKKLKTQDVAKVLNITDSAVSSWKAGRAFPDVFNLIKLVELGLSINEILPYPLVCKNELNRIDSLIDSTKCDIDYVKQKISSSPNNLNQYDTILQVHLENLKRYEHERHEKTDEFGHILERMEKIDIDKISCLLD